MNLLLIGSSHLPLDAPYAASLQHFGVFQQPARGVEAFELREDVWVCNPRYAMPIANILRQSLIDVAGVRLASEGQQTKMALLYEYLTSPRFRQRVAVIVEKFGDMHEDLEKERKAMTRLWAKREEQIRSVIVATAGMYGDLQGIAGKTLREIEGLELEIKSEAPQLPERRLDAE